MTYKEFIEHKRINADERLSRLIPIWVEMSKKYPLEDIPNHLRGTIENQQWQDALLDYQNINIYVQQNNIDLDSELGSHNSN